MTTPTPPIPSTPASVCLSPKWLEPTWGGIDDVRPILFKSANMEECLARMTEGGLGFVVVLDEKTHYPMGIIDAMSILRYSLEKDTCLIAKAGEIAGPCDHLVARSKDSVEHVLDSFSAEYILLVDDAGIFQGIVTRSEMLFQANKRLRDCIRMSDHMTEEMRAELTILRKHSGDILSMLAHDLRGPLGGIQGVAHLIADESMPLPPDQIQHFAKLIAVESATLVQMTSSVLEASRISVSSTVQLKMAICQPVDLLQTACALYQIMARKKGITFTLNFPEKPIPDIVADRERIIRVLSNLLDNAIKYCRKGETIQTTIEATPRIVTFVISDNGQGLAKAEIPNLFKPFAKGSSRPTGGEPSSGLGLSIALDIMRSHGGSITASGDTNRGLSFRVSLGIHDLFPAHS